MGPSLRGTLTFIVAMALFSFSCTSPEHPASPPPPVASAPAALSTPAAPPAPSAGPPVRRLPGRPNSPLSPADIAVRFDAARAYRDVEELSDPSYQGRHVGTPGELKGAEFMSRQFRAAGLQPGGDNGGYIQEFPMTVTELQGMPDLRILGPGSQNRALRLRDDFRPVVTGPLGPGTAEGESYFAGYGDNLNPDEAKGRVLILVLARRALRDVLPELRQAGAAGLVLTSGSQPLRKGELGNSEPDAIPTAQVNRDGFNALIQAAGKNPEELRQGARDNRDLPAFPLGVNLRLSTTVERKEIRARNVVGVLPGQTDDVVVVGGHYEEIGPDPDGVMYPAGNDTASGTAVVLDLARLLREMGVQPQASVVFIGWSGHEEGLLGSAYYVEHPTLPLERTRAYLNLDTIGQGSGANLVAATDAPNLQELLTEVQRELEGLVGKKVPMNSTAQRGDGSDHVNFRRWGVPSVAFSWEGLFQSPIHTPEDDARVVDPEKLRITGQVSALTLLKLAMR